MMSNHLPPKLRARRLTLLTLLVIFIQTSAAQPARTRQDAPPARQVAHSILVRWQGKPGVERYRLQLATDAGFNDIVFDRAVVGRQHLVEGLTPGRYFWRIAPAAKETGAFSQPAEVEVTASANAVTVANVVAPADLGGWRTATGEVLRPASAQLRSGGVVDLVGMNSDGTIYAIDGANGIALWTSRFRPGAPAARSGGDAVSQFGPLPFQQKDAGVVVVVAVEGGVRALRGDSGREAWRATLEGRPVSGAAGDLNADGAPEVVVVTSDPHRFYVLDGATGRALANQKLDAEIVGAPHLMTAGEPRAVALALKDGAVEIRGADGALVRSAKMTAEVTTAPLVVKRGENSLIVVGTREGLVALTIDELKALGRIVPESDVVRGTLTAADVDNDGATEIILLTRRGRVALVSTVDGNVKWYAEGATDAESAVFADVNADGVLDVIVPGGNSFAVGYSGRDGSLVWKVEEPGAKPQGGGDARARTLVLAPSLGGGAIVVGSDPSRVGLRAVELPKGAVKTAAND